MWLHMVCNQQYAIHDNEVWVKKKDITDSKEQNGLMDNV